MILRCIFVAAFAFVSLSSHSQDKGGGSQAGPKTKSEGEIGGGYWKYANRKPNPKSKKKGLRKKSKRVRPKKVRSKVLMLPDRFYGEYSLGIGQEDFIYVLPSSMIKEGLARTTQSVAFEDQTVGEISDTYNPRIDYRQQKFRLGYVAGGESSGSNQRPFHVEFRFDRDDGVTGDATAQRIRLGAGIEAGMHGTKDSGYDLVMGADFVFRTLRGQNAFYDTKTPLVNNGIYPIYEPATHSLDGYGEISVRGVSTHIAGKKGKVRLWLSGGLCVAAHNFATGYDARSVDYDSFHFVPKGETSINRHDLMSFGALGKIAVEGTWRLDPHDNTRLVLRADFNRFFRVALSEINRFRYSCVARVTKDFNSRLTGSLEAGFGGQTNQIRINDQGPILNQLNTNFIRFRLRKRFWNSDQRDELKKLRKAQKNQ